MTELTIGELSERSGVATSAIRYYEARGLVRSRRTTGNQRRYARAELRDLVEGRRGDDAHRGELARGNTTDTALVTALLADHPDRTLVPGVEISSGSLGHGLPLAVGTALGLRAQGIDARVVVLVGDAELDEGSNHEALELAAALDLDALTVVVIDNRTASYAVPGRIAARFATEGWQVETVDGRDQVALEAALTTRSHGVPNVVVATVLDPPTGSGRREEVAA